MTGNPQDPQRGRLEDLGRKIDEHIGSAIPRAEEELRRVIAYLNDEVVPQVRRNSSEALKIAAEQLHKLAEALDRSNRPPSSGSR
ncbi:MAG TPA: hypothetical protein VM554_11015 [Acidisarcina sp.]|nr:hypothetical protein [Acidisarcina sp.]